MEKNILNAFKRIKGNKKFNEKGFIAGVFYGDNAKEATLVKFEELPIRKILTKHGSNAKVWVKYGDDTKFGFIKEIQRHPVSAKINHIDIQLVSQNHEVKLQIPISFKGEEKVIDNLLKLNIHKSEVDVFGSMALMPDVVNVDVSEKKLGDTITIKDFNLDKLIKVTDKEDEIYAAITQMKEKANSDTDEEVSAEPEAKEQ